MKYSILLLSSCFFFCFTTYLPAQVKLNPQVGVNVSALDAKLGDLRTEAKAGWHAGLDLRIGQGFVYLSPGAFYYSNTARLLQDLNDPDLGMLKDETTIQSIKAPLNLGLNLMGNSKFLGIRAEGGITPTYVTSIRETDSFSLNIEDLNRLTWAYNVGVGVDLLFLTADLTYEIGQADFFQDAEGRNNVLSLNVGIKF